MTVKHSRQQRGQAMVETALLSILLIYLAMGAADFGRMRFGYVTVTQAAKDGARKGAAYPNCRKTVTNFAAVTTGCSSSGTPACTYTASYINSSGTVLGTIGSGIPTGAAGVQVVPQKSLTSFLASIMGASQTQVSATASAIYGALGSASCGSLFPSVLNGDTNGDGTYDGSYTIGACYLSRDAPSGGSGSFGWVDLDGSHSSASALRTLIDTYASTGDSGCTSTITAEDANSANDDINTSTGNKSSVQSSVLTLIDSTHNEITMAVYSTYGQSGDGCTSGSASGGHLCYHVKGFVRVRVTDVRISGSTVYPSPDTTPCAQSLMTSDGILVQIVGFVDPNGTISNTASGPAKVVNVIN